MNDDFNNIYDVTEMFLGYQRTTPLGYATNLHLGANNII